MSASASLSFPGSRHDTAGNSVLAIYDLGLRPSLTLNQVRRRNQIWPLLNRLLCQDHDLIDLRRVVTAPTPLELT